MKEPSEAKAPRWADMAEEEKMGLIESLCRYGAIERWRKTGRRYGRWERYVPSHRLRTLYGAGRYRALEPGDVSLANTEGNWPRGVAAVTIRMKRIETPATVRKAHRASWFRRLLAKVLP